jgi:hypothetical protein
MRVVLCSAQTRALAQMGGKIRKLLSDCMFVHFYTFVHLALCKIYARIPSLFGAHLAVA